MLELFIETTLNKGQKITKVLKKAAQSAASKFQKNSRTSSNPIGQTQYYDSQYLRIHGLGENTDIKVLNKGGIKRTIENLTQEQLQQRKAEVKELLEKRPVYKPSVEGKEDFRRITDVDAENKAFMEIAESQTLNSQTFENFKRLLFIDGRKFQLKEYEIENLLQTDKKILKNMFDRNLLKSIEGRTEDLSVDDCIHYASLSPSKWKRIAESGILKDYDKKGKAFNSQQIEILYSASPEYKKRFLSFLNSEERPVNFSEAIKLAKLNDSEWNKVKELFTLKWLSKEQDFSGDFVNGEPNIKLVEKFVDIEYLLKSLMKRTPVEIEEIKKVLAFSQRENPIGIGNAVEIVTSKLPSETGSERLFERVQKLGLLGSDNIFGEEISQHYIVKLAKKSDESLKQIADYKNFLCKNMSILQQHNADALKEEDVMELVLQYYTPQVIKTVGEDVLRYASSLKYEGLKDFLSLCQGLKHYPKDLLEQIESKLKTLTHPEQRLEKLRIILSIGQKQYDEDITVVTNLTAPPTKVQIANINKILGYIKPAKTSDSQLKNAVNILSDKSVSQKHAVENFIKEFNVPINRQERVRTVLSVKSAEEQLAVIEQKLKQLASNTKLPQEKKRLIKGQLELEKSEILYNPDTASRIKMTTAEIQKLEALIEAHINLPTNNKDFAKNVKSLMYENLKISPSETLVDSLDFDGKYLHTLFASGSKKRFTKEFKELIALLDSNPRKKLSVLRESLPQNKETKKLFETYKLNYPKWSTYNEALKTKFEVNIKAKDVIESSSKNLAQEIIRLNENCKDVLKKVKEAVETTGCQLDAAQKLFVKKDSTALSQKDLSKIYTSIEEAVNKLHNEKINDHIDFKTFESHLPIHKKNIKSLKDVKDMKEEFFVRLSDVDDVGRNLFFGNHVGCCTSVGACNSFAAPQHLMNSFVRGIEIVDEAGNSFGNSMCYFADIDGKLHFVIDSFEANGKLGADKGVTKAITDYAKLVVKEMGQPDTPVVFGPNYNKISLEDYQMTKHHTAKIIGKSAGDTYIDLIEPHYVKMTGATAKNVSFYTPKIL